MSSLREMALAARRRQILRMSAPMASIRRSGEELLHVPAEQLVRQAYREMGENVSLSRLRKTPAYRQLMTTMRANGEAYGRQTQGAVAFQQSVAVGNGVNDARSLVSKVNSRLIPGTGSLDTAAGSAFKGRLRSMFGGYGRQAQRNVKASLEAAVAKGASAQRAVTDVNLTTRRAVDRGVVSMQQESMSAYREAERSVYQQTNGIGRWACLAVLDRRTCPICYSQHGKVFLASGSLVSHVGCRCVLVPVTPRGGSPIRPSGEDVFARLTRAEKLRLLGPTRLALYDEGVSLSSMVGLTLTRPWGVSRRLRPLRDLDT